jgi:hypothetical protein
MGLLATRKYLYAKSAVIADTPVPHLMVIFNGHFIDIL